MGDSFRIGDLDLVISGTIVQEPDRSLGVFSLGPRVMIADDDLDRTGLVRVGSRVRYRTLIKLPEGEPAESWSDALGAKLPDLSVRIITYAQAQPGFRRFWTQLTMYLGMSGLVALMVGGIGVAVSVRAFVREKFATIAVLKCLGAGWRDVFRDLPRADPTPRARGEPGRRRARDARSSSCWRRCSSGWCRSRSSFLSLRAPS